MNERFRFESLHEPSGKTWFCWTLPLLAAFGCIREAKDIAVQTFMEEEMTNSLLSLQNQTLVPLLPLQGPTLHCKFDNWVQHQVKLWVWQWANQSSMGVKQTAFQQKAQSHRGDSSFMASHLRRWNKKKTRETLPCWNLTASVVSGCKISQ